MSKNEWEELGDQIQSIVNHAVRDNDYGGLNESINDLLAHTIDTGSDALKDILSGALGAGKGSQHRSKGYKSGKQPRQDSPYQRAAYPYRNPEHSATAYETHNHHGYQTPPFGASQMTASGQQMTSRLYASVSSPRLKATGMTIAGGILSLEALGGLFEALVRVNYGFGVGVGFGLTIVFGALGAWLLYKGISTLGLIKRFQVYRKALGKKTYAQLSQLAALINRPVSFVAKDARKMIEKGWFKEGHVDEEETTLMSSDETYRQYLDTHTEMIRRRQEEEEKKAREKKAAEETAQKQKVSKEVQDVLDRGNGYIERIHECNDAIPGEEISAKISRMELLVRRILDRAQAHPEIIPDLKKMMNYYLPTTIKLLDAYQDMDAQPVQGENIRSSKKQIEETLDTLNTAFERLLDSIFQDTAWDVSSDISVLNTMLQQEGLTDDGMRMSAAGTAEQKKHEEQEQQGVTLTL
ncbi:MAG: 5-bromo-4-chloroindolyl phosphate hydrolysis family protein [Blautia sp.]|nr:5-bromo-4-chloroindolyl phosphate hydrolysis family protein [Blautia sp.]